MEILILLLGFSLILVFYQIKKDIDNKKGKTIDIPPKIKKDIDTLNDLCYDNQAELIQENYSLELFQKTSPHHIKLEYQNDKVQIVWKFKYFQQEMVFKNSIEQQKQDIYKTIELFIEAYKNHEKKVDDSGITEAILVQNAMINSKESLRPFLQGTILQEKYNKIKNT